MNISKNLFRRWPLVAACLFLFACVAAGRLSSLLLKTPPSKASPIQVPHEHLDLPGALLINTSGSKKIVRMKANGTEKKVFKLECEEIALSPNGKKMVFVRGRLTRALESRGMRNDLYVADSEGMNERKILAPKSDYPGEMAWHPDNKKIAFAMIDPYGTTKNSQIWLINSDGTGLKKLTHGARDCYPCFSPNGKTMVFASGSNYVEMGEHRGLYSMDATGKNRRRLTTVHNRSNESVKLGEFTYGDDYSWPIFSRDGKSIAYVYTSHGSPKKEGLSNIYMMNVDGTHRKKLTSGTDGKTNLRFSPDDKFIAFFQDGDLWVTKTDGTSQRVIPNVPPYISSFDWH